MPKAYPREFREDVVISETCLTNWLAKADREGGGKAEPDRQESGELREAKRRIRLLEQENEVLRRAAAYLSQANLPPK